MAKNQVSVPQAFLDHTLQFIKLASYTTKRASDEVIVHRAEQEKAAALRGPVLAHLVQVGLVANDPQTKQGADAMLASHSSTLNLLKAAADMIVKLNAKLGEKQAADLGAGDPSLSEETPYQNIIVGGRASEKTASDLELYKILDAPSR